jgi:hypothetical protein
MASDRPLERVGGRSERGAAMVIGFVVIVAAVVDAVVLIGALVSRT